MKTKIALYALGIGIFVVGSLIYNHLVHGEAINLGRLWLAMILLPLFGFFVWLRWDWTPNEGRKQFERDKKAAAEFRAKIESEKAKMAEKDGK
jgi:hypothetical protein